MPTETPRSSVAFLATPHTSDIESLELRGALLAIADASGHASLLRVRNWANGATAALEVASQLAPPFAASHGWTGIRFAGDKVVTASFGGRYIAAYDDGKLVSTAPTASRPAALCVTEEGTVLVAEGNSLSAWDLRAAFAPVKRLRVRSYNA